MHSHRHLRAARVFIPTLILLGLLALVSVYSPIAQAAGIVVDSTADDTLANLDANTTCDLREAITNANDGAQTYADCAAGVVGADTITFSVSGTITLGSSLPAIVDDLTIDGSANAADITISGDNQYRVMEVESGITLTLDTLTIANGMSNSDYGGGIYNFGTLNIANSTFRGNSAPNAGGGAIMNQFATLNIVNSTFSGNTGGLGGGILNFQGTANVANSTFSGNSATTGGGGILAGGVTNIANSTFSGNSATASNGGAILIDGGTTNLKNSIITNSTGGDCNINVGAMDGSNNLIDDTTCGAALSFRSGAVTNFDTTLANNGGPTQTHKLNANSNAINVVPGGECTYISSGTNPLFTDGATIPTDQRGVTRPQGALCDIGAYEFVAPTAVDVTGMKGLVNKNGNIILRWKTVTESRIAGFNIYRQGKQGEWKQINTKFRQAKHAGSALGGTYRFVDRKANATKTQRYKIEIVYLDGHSEWTKIVRVAPR